MRNAQKTALMALFAAMEDTIPGDKPRREPAEPVASSDRPIEVDMSWLVQRSRKGRA